MPKQSHVCETFANTNKELISEKRKGYLKGVLRKLTDNLQKKMSPPSVFYTPRYISERSNNSTFTVKTWNHKELTENTETCARSRKIRRRGIWSIKAKAETIVPRIGRFGHIEMGSFETQKQEQQQKKKPRAKWKTKSIHCTWWRITIIDPRKHFLFIRKRQILNVKNGQKSVHQEAFSCKNMQMPYIQAGVNCKATDCLTHLQVRRDGELWGWWI